MEWDYLHLIKGDKINLAYHYPTFNMIVVNDIAYQILKSLQKGMSISEVLAMYTGTIIAISIPSFNLCTIYQM
jgi:hypothetical protein